MKEEQVTYTTDDMLKLINTAATNLILKKKKAALEGKIRKQMEEREYTQELIARAKKMISELDPELRKAEDRAGEARELFSLLKVEHSALEIELERLRDITRKAALLKERTAEAATLREKVAALQEQSDLIRPAYTSKRTRKEELENNKQSSVAVMRELSEKLASLTALREQLIARISDFDLAGYLETLRRDISALGRKTYSGSLEEELLLLNNCLRCFRKVKDLSMRLEEVSPEVRGMFAGADKLKESGLLSVMSEEIKKHAAGFAAYARGELSGLEERKLDITAEIQSTAEKLEHMQADINRSEKAIINEQEFSAHSQERLKELEYERAAEAAELERIKKEAERVHLTIEVNRAFAESLGPSNEYMRNSNRRMEVLLEEYKRAFEKVARVIREEA
jgi:hypothetical protein